MELIGLLWNEVIVRPLTNGLLLLYVVLFSNLGLAIIAFTFISRVVTYPLHIKQLKQTQKMSALGPRMKELREKFKSDPRRQQQETMNLYKEMGVSPIGCLGPLVLQMPIFIGLFYAVRNVVPFTPENLAGLSDILYSWLPVLHRVVPVERGFLGLDLGLSVNNVQATGGLLSAVPYYFLAVLSGAGMWLQQKMMARPGADPQQASQQRMMLWLLPVFFIFISVTFPSGLVLYWVFSTLVGIIIQYFVMGWGGLRPNAQAAQATSSAPAVVEAKVLPAGEEREGDGERQRSDDSQDGGGSDRNRNARARRRPRGGRSRRR
ncbi:MAG: YidC/Oxa1 family membrane protein insertase [Chloroflexi bacterium]|nr:YidC/Oxa1 family membrane protein insertase [Chloroflexota bacterium]